MSYNVDALVVNKSSNKLNITTDVHMQPTSVSRGPLTMGADGSLTLGSGLISGVNPTNGDFIFGASIPYGQNSNVGVTITVNGNVVKGVAIGVAGAAAVSTLGPGALILATEAAGASILTH